MHVPCQLSLYLKKISLLFAVPHLSIPLVNPVKTHHRRAFVHADEAYALGGAAAAADVLHADADDCVGGGEQDERVILRHFHGAYDRSGF